MADVSIQNYLNTLIFVIIAKAISVALFVCIIFNWGWKLLYLISTIILGLICIIAYAMYNIYKIEKAVKKAQEDASKALPFLNTCPDYYVRSNANVPSGDGVTSNVHIVCNNTYTGSDNRYTYIMGAGAGSSNIDLDAMTAQYKTMSELCSANANTYTNTSWTDFKARCGVLDTYTGH